MDRPKGFIPKAGIKKAPPELVGKESASEITPRGITKTSKARAMFGEAAPVVFAPVQFKPKVAKVPKVVKPVEEPVFEESKEEPKEESKEEPKGFYSADMEEMKDLILEEESASPYNLPVPAAYVPESRQGFSEFIKHTYPSFMLDPKKAMSTVDGEKYPYQRFIREYMRNESPYRGILTYHGLGSGKTCTAIATSEALYSTARKKIIVMTPASLRKNFLKEVSACGFRHFQLKNYWVSMPVSDPTARLFGNSVLRIPETHLKTAQSIWIPDFRKTQKEENYSSLSADEQTEIRKQILSILVWDEKTNPNGQIHFMNYNGSPSSATLKRWACQPGGATIFNDAVIIIDEIHNLVRLMQGTIDPYLQGNMGARRIIEKEDVTMTPWKPTLCATEGKNYMRGYLYYRLLLDAKNSKIVGLSGTPIINFPEELGILMNVLHGYIPTIDILVQESGRQVGDTLRSAFLKYPYIDFVRVAEDSKGGTKATLTLLPYGIKKLENSVGVEKLPPDAPVPTLDEIIGDLKGIVAEGGMNLAQEISTRALPLLPPFGEEFRKNFINAEGIQNKIVLVKRLSGMISYYKGSRADLMPRIKSDEVIRVPMSPFSQKGYVEARTGEIKSEKGKKSTGEMGGAWAEVYDIGKSSSSNNYKMSSRQACNFVFPSGVKRPKALSKKEELAEANRGVKLGDDIVITSNETANDETFPELEIEEEKELADAEQEDEAIERAANPMEGGQGKEDEDLPTPATLTEPLTTLAKKSFKFNPTSLKEAMEAKAAAQREDCRVGRRPEEKNNDEAILRAKECLRSPKIARYSLVLGGENGLETHSPKYAEMLKRIQDAPGSSLVYSQFLDMEGIGIFRIAMDVNGYSPIEITNGADGPAFTAATLESLAKGPGGQSRYMTFSGVETPEIRRFYLDIFNANFNELPENLKRTLEDYKFINNFKGEIARVFCITSAGAEGLSLKCVRAVHIMEPYWNDTRLKQVKGRAIRIGSHLDLPEKDRDVAIYTYLTKFPETAQTEKSGDLRIDETIRQADAIDKQSAVALKLPIPAGATQYVMTTDEKIYAIAERKMTITNALENTMKSAAVDCELNIKENKDGKFQCITLEGKVGDFLYHPELAIDIMESASAYSMAAKPTSPVEKELKSERKYVMKLFKKVPYRMVEIRNEAGDLTGFEMYGETDAALKTLLGTAGAKDGNPAAPVKMV
jgi:hypothetical protein